MELIELGIQALSWKKVVALKQNSVFKTLVYSLQYYESTLFHVISIFLCEIIRFWELCLLALPALDLKNSQMIQDQWWWDISFSLNFQQDKPTEIRGRNGGWTLSFWEKRVYIRNFIRKGTFLRYENHFTIMIYAIEMCSIINSVTSCVFIIKSKNANVLQHNCYTESLCKKQPAYIIVSAEGT